MKNILGALCVLAILMASCSKTGQPAPSDQLTSANPPPMVTFRGKEDEDRPVLMQKVYGRSNVSLESASVRLTQGSLSVEAFTAKDGSCTITLPAYGSWELHIGAEGYEDLVQEISITDSINLRTDTLR